MSQLVRLPVRGGDGGEPVSCGNVQKAEWALGDLGDLRKEASCIHEEV